MVSTQSSPPEKVTRMHPQRRRKSARISDAPPSATEPSTMPRDSSWRDWSSLVCGPAMLIAEHILSADVADYVRFRAVCRPWRQCTANPPDDALDRRFHPHRWTMLQNVLGRGNRRYRYSRFQNIDTGERIRMTIRGLDGRDGSTLLAPTTEGLLVLLNKRTHDVWVVNPITGAHTDLPPVTTLISDYPRDLVFPRWPSELHRLHVGAELISDSAVMIYIYFGEHQLLGIAWPHDEEWTKLVY